MQLQSLHQYIESNKLGKKEYLFIKKFCIENEIDIINFFKKEKGYNDNLIKDFFIMAFSKSIQDEEVISHFLKQQEDLPHINFKGILQQYNMILDYQHLLGLSKEEELSLLVEEKNYDKLVIFLQNHTDYKTNKQIETLILTDFSSIEFFEKNNLPFDKQSYNKLDTEYNKLLDDEQSNNNFIKLNQFYDFIEKNKHKISFEKRKEYLQSIMQYGELTVNDFKKKSYWDYVFIPLIHEHEYPELSKSSNFFMNLIKYKEQIFSETEPYNTLKVLTNFTSKEKIDVLLNYVKKYKVEEYNNTAFAIFNHFIKEINKDFINDFFKLGILEGYVFRFYLKDEYQIKHEKINENKYIEVNSKCLDNDIIRSYHETIAKQILTYKHMFKYRILKNYIPVNKDLLNKKEFLLSLKNIEFAKLLIELKENNLQEIAAKVLEIRLEEKLPEKGIKTKPNKI